MHDALFHKLFATDFLIREKSTPDSTPWQGLETYMKKYMATPDFESVWPAIIAAPSYIGKAFSQMNGQRSALTLSGVEPRSDVKIFNVHPNWDKLTQKQAQHVLNCVEAHSRIIDERGFISERVVDQTYQEGDACCIECRIPRSEI